MSVVRWTIGMAILAYCAAPAIAQSSIQTAFNYRLQDETNTAPPAPGAPNGDAAPERSGSDMSGMTYSEGYVNGPGYVNGYGCGNDCVDGCGNGCGNGAWSLSDCLTPNCCNGPTYGGWYSFGYYTDHERLSSSDGDERSFNDLPDQLNLDQAWFYVEDAARAGACSADWGYRFDLMYGAQGHTAQSFGNDGGTWDISWDHGPYEWAIPQLYAEVAFGDWNVKIGHFFTPAGYEVVPATGNFFYSHSLTHYNSEPFTHTGILGAYSANDCLTVYVGWALGWDTGFDQFGDGNIFLGGWGYDMGDVNFTYIVTAGNFGWRSGDQEGFSHHLVSIFDLSRCWQYVFQHDYVHTDGVVSDPTYENDDVGVTNYLFYTIDDCWKLGGRAEWWRSNNVVLGDHISFYEVSGGANYKPHSNVVVRPEVRYDWTDENVAGYDQTWFGVDAVFTY